MFGKRHHQTNTFSNQEDDNSATLAWFTLYSSLCSFRLNALIRQLLYSRYTVLFYSTVQSLLSTSVWQGHVLCDQHLLALAILFRHVHDLGMLLEQGGLPRAEPFRITRLTTGHTRCEVGHGLLCGPRLFFGQTGPSVSARATAGAQPPENTATSKRAPGTMSYFIAIFCFLFFVRLKH